MLSTIPSLISKLSKHEFDMEIARVGIIAELDAVNLYEQLAASALNEDLRKVLLEIAKEEKTHIGEFQAFLLRLDKEQAEELEKGRKEVKELTGR
jgi:rubrerythrin